MTLTPEVIAFCKQELQIQNDFSPNDIVVANHELFDQWREATQRYKLPKLVFYILMDEVFGATSQKDSNGNLGRKLKITVK